MNERVLHSTVADTLQDPADRSQRYARHRLSPEACSKAVHIGGSGLPWLRLLSRFVTSVSFRVVAGGHQAQLW